MDNVKNTIRKYIVYRILSKKDESSLSYDAPLIEDGTLDSMSINTLVGFLEREFDVEISTYDMTLNNFESIDAITALVKKKITEQNDSMKSA